MSSEVYWLLIGAAIGAIGAIVGGFVQGLASDWFERRRAAAEKREQWIQTALEWAANGRKDSLRRADLQGADLREVDLGPGPDGDKGADLSYSNLRRANLENANLTGANLSGANLLVAVLSGADLRQADLSGADLTGADLRGAYLQLANLTGAGLGVANLTSADLSGANLTGTNLTGAHLANARYDRNTQWPDGFTPPPEAIKVEVEAPK